MTGEQSKGPAVPAGEWALASGRPGSRWSTEDAAEWYSRQPWLVGCNFIPSTAINQLEMWQAESFDPETIARELGWAASLGFNVVRVYLHDLLWEAGAGAFLERVRRYLEVAAGRGIRTLFVLFDDCWNDSPRLGRQPDPVRGVHNSGWVQSPGRAVVLAPEKWPRLERYVRGVVGALADDSRVLGWDLYNEPGNRGLGESSLPLVEAAFAWARGARPCQPLTCGVWSRGLPAMSARQIELSDIISFHCYERAGRLRDEIRRLRAFGRPLICTEYMARTRASLFQSSLPVFRRERVGCMCWGLVSGKTQTIYPWGSEPGGPEPEPWFHDVFRPDGTPYDGEEAEFIRSQTALRDSLPPT